MSVSWQTLWWMIAAGAATPVAAFFLNGIEPIREFPGKNALVLRMAGLFSLVPLLVTLLTSADEKGILAIVGRPRVLCWMAVGGVVIALLYDGGKLVRSLRRERMRESQVAAGTEAVSYAPKLRRELLKEARRQVKQRLKYAYGEQALINLVMQSQQDKVSGADIEGDVFLMPQPKRQIESVKDGRIRLAESERTILETFDDEDVAGQLLILGAPGSGKTTTLLTLAEQLLIRAENSVEIPYIFELSTWQAEQQDIASWLMAQLKFEHSIDESVSRQWILDGHLLPLLDGLDEVDATRRQRCVQKINEFVTGKLGQPVVVCCRARVYDQIVQRGEEKLDSLNGSLRLQPLEIAQVQAYFERMGRQDILTALQDSQGLGALAQPREDADGSLLSIPLFVQILVIAYQSDKKITTKLALLEAYITQRLSVEQRTTDRQLAKKKLLKIRWAHESIQKEPDERETKRYLSWLAVKLNENAIPNVFLIEQMQPSWLETKAQRQQYHIFSFLLVFMLLSFPVFLAIGLAGSFAVGSVFGAFVSFLSIVIGIPDNWDKIKPVEKVQLPLRYAPKRKFATDVLRGLPFLVLSTLLLGPVAGLCFSLVSQQNISPIWCLILGNLSVLVFFLISYLIAHMKNELEVRDTPNQGILSSTKNSFLSILFVSLVFVLLGLVLDQSFKIDDASAVGSILCILIAPPFGFIVFGGFPVVQHGVVRFLLHRQGHIPHNYAQFLRYTTERRLTQQIGGRFRFIHRELLDHFAAMYDSPSDMT